MLTMDFAAIVEFMSEKRIWEQLNKKIRKSRNDVKMLKIDKKRDRRLLNNYM
jgi:transketolase C-terminal domain/subunit